MSGPPPPRDFNRDDLYRDYQQPQQQQQQQQPYQQRTLPPPGHGLPPPPSHPQGVNHDHRQRARSRSPQRQETYYPQDRYNQRAAAHEGFGRQADRAGAGHWDGPPAHQQSSSSWDRQPQQHSQQQRDDWSRHPQQHPQSDYRQGGPPPRNENGAWGGDRQAGDWTRDEPRGTPAWSDKGPIHTGRPAQYNQPPQIDPRRQYDAPLPAWETRSRGGYDQQQQQQYNVPFGGPQQQQQQQHGAGPAYSNYDTPPQQHQHQPAPSFQPESSYPPIPHSADPASKRKDVPSEVSRHIIFLGLDNEMREADLFNFLTASGAKVESTTIIKDKITGLSKGFGFALFAHTTAASDFLNAHYPAVLVPFGDQPPRRVKIDFSASTNQPGHSSAKHGWGVAAAASSPVNDGTRDIASGPVGTVLLIRGVDVVTRWEEVLDRLVNVQGGSGRGVKRVVGLRDRGTGGSWGFGFVEMRTTEYAKALLAHCHSPTENPAGFQISPSSRPVSMSAGNAATFVPQPGGGEGCIAGSVNGLGGCTGPVSYWDHGAAVVELYAQGWEAAEASDNELAAFLSTITPQLATVTQAAVQSISAPPPAASSAPAVPAVKSIALSNEPLVPIAIKVASKLGSEKPIKSVFGAVEHDEHEEEAANAAAAKARGLIKIPPISNSRKVASSISKWNTKQSELASDPLLPAVAPQPTASTSAAAHASPASASSSRPITSQDPSPLVSTVEPGGEFEYSDTTKNACLLCQRQLKSIDLLRKHNAASDLHKKNLLDSNLCKLAKERVAALPPLASTSEYRDRASERRTVFQQPLAPPPSSHRSHSNAASIQTFKGGRKFVEGPAPPPPAPTITAGLAPGMDESNVGNKMLSKMGWTEGSGLGLKGEGRVDPVQAAIYARGGGLGATKPTTEPRGHQDSGRGGYGQKTRDSARDRY